MATDKNRQDFYDEVDRYRHQNGCLSVVVLVIILIAVLGAVIWLVRRYHF